VAPLDESASALSGEVEDALAGIDDADPGTHAEAFEAVNAAILAELERLEAI
jgi:hypothetical protein